MTPRQCWSPQGDSVAVQGVQAGLGAVRLAPPRNPLGRPPGRGYAPRVSSDAFADLARGLAGFSAALRSMLNDHRLPAPGSPADTEAAGEPFAGEWGAAPSRDVFATVLLNTWSAVDHLAATACVLQARTAIAAPYTLVRAATEASTVAAYVTEPRIGPRERLRRNMNRHLEGLGEDINLLTPFGTAAARVTQHQDRIAQIGRSATVHGFKFTPMKGRTPAFIDTKQPSTMALMDACLSQTPGLWL
jgi:hypothetical protein